jgi:hypothetical protein
LTCEDREAKISERAEQKNSCSPRLKEYHLFYHCDLRIKIFYIVTVSLEIPGKNE